MITGESNIKAILPEFDLLRIDEVRSMVLSFSYRYEPEHTFQTTDVEAAFTYLADGNRYRISLALVGVYKLRLPELGTYMFDFAELDIFPISDPPVEGLRYCIDDSLGGMFGYCSDVAFTSIGIEQEDGTMRVLWKSETLE